MKDLTGDSMEPTTPQTETPSPTTTPAVPTTPVTTSAPLTPPKKSKRKLWAIICLTGPTALLILSFAMFAIINYAASSDYSSGPNGTSSNSSMAQISANFMLFLLGTIGTISWLPGIIVGIILLATKPAAPRQ